MRLLTVVLVLALTQPPDPPPGNPDHTAPEAGWFCYANTPIQPAPDGHACACHSYRQCYRDPSTGEQVVVEHASCRVYCFRDHCRCPIHCPDTE